MTANVFVVARLDDAGKMEIQGVFSTRAAASAICKTERDAVVTFPLDADCTEERTFEIEVPLAGGAPALVTA